MCVGFIFGNKSVDTETTYAKRIDGKDGHKPAPRPQHTYPCKAV